MTRDDGAPAANGHFAIAGLLTRRRRQRCAQPALAATGVFDAILPKIGDMTRTCYFSARHAAGMRFLSRTRLLAAYGRRRRQAQPASLSSRLFPLAAF